MPDGWEIKLLNIIKLNCKEIPPSLHSLLRQIIKFSNIAILKRKLLQIYLVFCSQKLHLNNHVAKSTHLVFSTSLNDFKM